MAAEKVVTGIEKELETCLAVALYYMSRSTRPALF